MSGESYGNAFMNTLSTPPEKVKIHWIPDGTVDFLFRFSYHPDLASARQTWNNDIFGDSVQFRVNNKLMETTAEFGQIVSKYWEEYLRVCEHYRVTIGLIPRSKIVLPNKVIIPVCPHHETLRFGWYYDIMSERKRWIAARRPEYLKELKQGGISHTSSLAGSIYFESDDISTMQNGTILSQMASELLSISGPTHDSNTSGMFSSVAAEMKDGQTNEKAQGGASPFMQVRDRLRSDFGTFLDTADTFDPTITVISGLGYDPLGYVPTSLVAQCIQRHHQEKNLWDLHIRQESMRMVEAPYIETAAISDADISRAVGENPTKSRQELAKKLESDLHKRQLTDQERSVGIINHLRDREMKKTMSRPKVPHTGNDFSWGSEPADGNASFNNGMLDFLPRNDREESIPWIPLPAGARAASFRQINGGSLPHNQYLTERFTREVYRIFGLPEDFLSSSSGSRYNREAITLLQFQHSRSARIKELSKIATETYHDIYGTQEVQEGACTAIKDQLMPYIIESIERDFYIYLERLQNVNNPRLRALFTVAYTRASMEYQKKKSTMKPTTSNDCISKKTATSGGKRKRNTDSTQSTPSPKRHKDKDTPSVDDSDEISGMSKSINEDRRDSETRIRVSRDNSEGEHIYKLAEAINDYHYSPKDSTEEESRFDTDFIRKIGKQVFEKYKKGKDRTGERNREEEYTTADDILSNRSNDSQLQYRTNLLQSLSNALFRADSKDAMIVNQCIRAISFLQTLRNMQVPDILDLYENVADHKDVEDVATRFANIKKTFDSNQVCVTFSGASIRSSEEMLRDYAMGAVSWEEYVSTTRYNAGLPLDSDALNCPPYMTDFKERLASDYMKNVLSSSNAGSIVTATQESIQNEIKEALDKQKQKYDAEMEKLKHKMQLDELKAQLREAQIRERALISTGDSRASDKDATSEDNNNGDDKNTTNDKKEGTRVSYKEKKKDKPVPTPSKKQETKKLKL